MSRCLLLVALPALWVAAETAERMPFGWFAYIPHANRPFVSVVDTETRQEVASILVGDTAKRISTVWLPF